MAPVFQSFLQGGFEGSTLRRAGGHQLDLIAATRHDENAEEDYRLLRRAGVQTVRDALRWHLIETAPGRYDWSSFLPMLAAARRTGVQVVWDLCHYGLPHDLDIWSPAFVDRFAAFAGAAARLVRDETDSVPFWCPVNEISFWSWAGGATGWMYPWGSPDRGDPLKRQLAGASIAACAAVRGVDPRARLVHAEPMIHIIPPHDDPGQAPAVEHYRQAQYEAWDMICGRMAPELGGRPEFLDVVGVNYYFNNQWEHNGETLGMGHRLYRPFHQMLAENHARYGRPIVLSETGAEGVNGASWLHYIGSEVRAALRAGVRVEGICFYPIMDYPGWEDARHCPSGLIRLDPEFRARRTNPALLRAFEEEAALFRPLLPARPALEIAAE